MLKIGGIKPRWSFDARLPLVLLMPMSRPLLMPLLQLLLPQALLLQPLWIIGKRGLVEATTSEDEDTCFGLVFKRKQIADVAIIAHSASDDRASSFGENPPSASSPRDIMVHEGGGESSFGGDHGTAIAADLLAFHQQALQSFQDWEMMESLGEDPL